MDPKDCSKAAKKNTVKIPNIETATILSLTIGLYLKMRDVIKYKNKANANSMVKLEPSKLPTLKSKKLIFPILDMGSLNK